MINRFGGSKCNKFSPFINNYHQVPDHFLVVEIIFFLSFAIQLVLALVNKRLGTLIGVLLFAFGIETISYFYLETHVHNPFVVQLTCYLPLKEVLWYGNSIFSSIIIVSKSGFNMNSFFSLLIISIFSAGLSILQDAPYEMTNTLVNVDLLALNEKGSKYADLSEKINHGSVLVIIGFFLMALSISLIAFMKIPEFFKMIMIPTLGLGIFPIIFMPFHFMKYIGCSHFYNGEKSFLDFHLRCAKFSYVKDGQIGLIFISGTVLVMISAFITRTTHKSSTTTSSREWIQILLLIINSCLIHGCFIYLASSVHLSFGDQKFSSIFSLAAILIVHVGLILFCLMNDSRGASQVVNDDKKNN